MKIKSHIFTSVMALCAAAVFSLTIANSAHAGFRGVVTPDPYVTPAPATETDPVTEPLPPMPAPVDSGTFNGTVMD